MSRDESTLLDVFIITLESCVNKEIILYKISLSTHPLQTRWMMEAAAAGGIPRKN